MFPLKQHGVYETTFRFILKLKCSFCHRDAFSFTNDKKGETVTGSFPQNWSHVTSPNDSWIQIIPPVNVPLTQQKEGLNDYLSHFQVNMLRKLNSTNEYNFRRSCGYSLAVSALSQSVASQPPVLLRLRLSRTFIGFWFLVSDSFNIAQTVTLLRSEAEQQQAEGLRNSLKWLYLVKWTI